MKIPKQITIFGNAIDVVEVDCLNEKMGDFSPSTNIIHIARHTLSDDVECELSPKQMEQAFWHEVFHAFQYYATGEYDEAQSQVYAGFMSELGKMPLALPDWLGRIMMSIIGAGLSGNTKDVRAYAKSLCDWFRSYGCEDLADDVWQLIQNHAKSSDDCGAVPAEEYRGHDFLLSGLKQQIQSGDKNAFLRAVKMRDKARDSGNTDFANKVDTMLSEFSHIIVYDTNLYIARSTGCDTTQIAVIAATTADEARQLIEAESGQGWIIIEDWMLNKPQAKVTVNINRPQVIVIV